MTFKEKRCLRSSATHPKRFIKAIGKQLKITNEDEQYVPRDMKKIRKQIDICETSCIVRK